MFIGYIILALLAMAFFHFILEGIIAPSHHMIHRLEMQRHARELDALHSQHSDQFPFAAYESMRKAIHNFINDMPRYNITTVIKVMFRLDHDSEFRTRCVAVDKVITDVEVPAVQEIHHRMDGLASRTLSWNSFGWAIYVVPVVLAIALYEKAHAALAALMSLPGKHLENSGSRFGSL